MASWSAENATKAYLSAFRMGERSKEPDVTEFISAIAAGNNSQTMLMLPSPSSPPDPTILLAMLAAAAQTHGHVICIAASSDHLIPTKTFLSTNNISSYQHHQVHFLIGQPHQLLTSEPLCAKADFIVVDCELENHQEIFNDVAAVVEKTKKKMVVVGYNAMKCKGSMVNMTCCWGYCGGTRTQLLPIGKGLLVTRFGDFGGGNNINNNNVVIGSAKNRNYGASGGGLVKFRSSSRWVVKVDNCTGEEHVFRVRLPHHDNKVVPA